MCSWTFPCNRHIISLLFYPKKSALSGCVACDRDRVQSGWTASGREFCVLWDSKFFPSPHLLRNRRDGRRVLEPDSRTGVHHLDIQPSSPARCFRRLDLCVGSPEIYPRLEASLRILHQGSIKPHRRTEHRKFLQHERVSAHPTIGFPGITFRSSFDITRDFAAPTPHHILVELQIIRSYPSGCQPRAVRLTPHHH